MSEQPLNYNAAVAAFYEVFEDKRSLPMQPNRMLSELRGTTGYLRNIRGRLARVNHRGDVRTGRIT